MTPAQVAHIMELVKAFGGSMAAYQSHIANHRFIDVELQAAARDSLAAVEAALRDAPQQAEPGMVSVTQKDANNYCLVLRALGMEDEGDPVAAIEDLKAAAEPAIQHVTVASLMQTRGYHALVQVIYELQQDGAYSDEDGEETNALVELLHAIEGTPSAPTAVEPDERAEFEAWWATMNEAPYYPGIQKRIAEHAFKAGRASKGKPT